MNTSTQGRIATGLGCLLSSVLIAAIMLGIVPDRRQAVLDGRAKLCEVVALTAGTAIKAKELRRLENILTMIVERHDDVLSAGVRRIDGMLLVDVGGHAREWSAPDAQKSIETNVQVPLYAGENVWGNVELRFTPITPAGIAGWLSDPNLRLTAFTGSACYLLFYIYLSRMLSYLDPTQAVPGHVRSALDTLAEGLLVIDRSERIVLANLAFARLVGRDPQKLIGRRATEFAWLNADGARNTDDWPWRKAIETKEPMLEAAMRLDVGDQGVRTFKMNCSPVLGDRDTCRGVLISLDDVTQIELQKVELANSKAEAVAANQAKSTFLANMSHEIRTPMNAVLGFTDLLRRNVTRDEDERRRHLDTIHASGEHLLNLINDILDLSKVESGRFEVERIECAPFEIAQEVLSVLQVKAEEKHLRLDLHVTSEIPEKIVTDPHRLRQILTNLTGNALKFTREGAVTIHLRLDTATREPRLIFDVVDTGVGIKPESLDKIFEPFTQADSSVTRNFGGTGLGLTISRKLAEALGGSLTASSVMGRGSTFTLSLPAGDLSATHLVNGDQLHTGVKRRQQVRRGTGSFRRIRPARILVADDGDSNRRLLELVLSKAGLTPVVVENGKEALERALAEPFEVVLMDMQMPIMDGYTAARRLREAGFAKPIVALTAHAMIGDEEKCLTAGCSDFLSKPLNIDRLLQLLADELGDDDSAEAAAEGAVSQPVEAVGPIASTLLADDPSFLEIVRGFVDKLKLQLNEMDAVCDRGEFAALARQAHWLKGSAGTLGFPAFTQPSVELEQFAKEQRGADAKAQIARLRVLSQAIVIPAPAAVH